MNLPPSTSLRGIFGLARKATAQYFQAHKFHPTEVKAEAAKMKRCVRTELLSPDRQRCLLSKAHMGQSVYDLQLLGNTSPLDHLYEGACEYLSKKPQKVGPFHVTYKFCFYDGVFAQVSWENKRPSFTGLKKNQK